MSAVYPKDPAAVVDFELDWSSWLAEGDSITQSDWDIADGLTEIEERRNHTDSTATVWLQGGVAGEEYAVTNTITTAQGRVDQRTVYIRVMER